MIAARLKCAVIGLTVACFAAHLPEGSAAAHQYADSVLFPRFTAAVNDWATQHPSDPDHAQKLNKPDVERMHVIREAFRDWNEAMKRAGY